MAVYTVPFTPSLTVRLEPYSTEELLSIAFKIAEAMTFIPQLAVVGRIVEACNGNPHELSVWLRRVSHLAGRETEDVEALLATLGLRFPGDATQSSVDLNGLSGTDFERLIVELLRRTGFRAEMTKASGDGGVDIIAHLERPLLGGRYLLQCKRFSSDLLVGGPVVREFYGALKADAVAIKGILVTTSGFTPQAVEFAKGLPLELIDGPQLQRLLKEVGLVERNEPALGWQATIPGVKMIPPN